MGKLSVFVDESGDFGAASSHSPYYIVTMVIHEQDNDISPQIDQLNAVLNSLNLPNHTIHAEPLIRREQNYVNMPPNDRRALFTRLFYFVIKSEITFKTFVFEKKQFENALKLGGRMAKEMSLFIRAHLDYFQSFDDVILYYDNGQHELNSILNAVLTTELSHYDSRKVLPKDYKLFQAADLICALQLLSLKCDRHELSNSELLLFHSERELRRQFLKPIQKKEFGL